MRRSKYAIDDHQWPPKFCKLELVLDNGTHLAFVDARRFGRVLLLDDPPTQVGGWCFNWLVGW
jgi:formamidopyrimidine-DNA glycosylase